MLNNPLLSRFVLLILLPVAVIIGWLGYLVFRSVPPTEGTFEVRGLEMNVEVSRDDWGVVYINAQSDSDAFFTMGYLQAQERLWQLEMQKRLAAGRLSEVFGKQMVDQDVFMRSLGLYAAAEKALQSLSPSAQSALKSYAAGVNAWIDQSQILPPEFLMFSIVPEPWQEVDSIAWIKVFALNLGGNYLEEMEHYAASQVLKQDQLLSLYPELKGENVETGMTNLNVDRDYIALLGELYERQQKQLQIGGKHVGSNAWVVSGEKNNNGGTILANDPHLGLQIPSYWYLANIKGDKIDAKGAALVGLPMILFGKNEQIAWGGTNLGADVQDLFVEQVNIKDANQYLADGQWLTMDEKIETITIKPDFPAAMNKPLKPLKVRVRSTRNGPIISDIYGIVENPVALKWTALEDSDTSFEAFFSLNYAKNWEDFSRSAELLVAPALNLLYADELGQIGLIGAGRIPMRKQGRGLLPVVGWDNDYQWQGYIPVDELPMIKNPSTGYIVSANDRAFDLNYPYFVSAKWAPKARANRISELLAEKIKSNGTIDIQGNMDIQGDIKDLAVAEILPLLQRLDCVTPEQCEAIDRLKHWDGTMDPTEVMPTIVTVWLDHLRQALMEDELQAPWKKDQLQQFLSRSIGNLSIDHMVNILKDPKNSWCDDIRTSITESCDEILRISLDSTLEELSKLAGSSMDNWQWGKWHKTLYRHQPFSQIKLLKGLFERGIENGGSVNSINVANASYQPTQGYVQSFGAGFRQIISLNGHSDQHWIINSTGQSGHILSKHYDDMVEKFNKVEYVQLHHRLDSQARRLSLLPKSE